MLYKHTINRLFNKKLHKTRLKSYALFYAVFIIAIIALLMGSLISVSYFDKMYIENLFQKENLRSNLSSGIKLILTDDKIIGPDETKKIILFDNEKDSIELGRKQWGIFEIAISKVRLRDIELSKIAFIGEYISKTEDIALYLAEQDKPLSLGGSTSIVGNCYLPKAGVKRAYIEGKSFSGTKLIDGNIKNSSNTLPNLNVRFQHIKKSYFQESYLDEHANKVFLYEDLKKDSLINSFSEKTIVLYSPDEILLEHKYLKGNIIVMAGKHIELSSDNQLEDIIVYAPSINIDDDFTGIIQVLASEFIYIGKDCSLLYPSAACVYSDELQKETPYIFLDENTEITGVVVLNKEQVHRKQIPLITIAKNVLIKGQVYCNGMIDHKGTVFGSVYVNRFMLRTASSVYDNHLLDAGIDISNLSAYYVGMDIINNQTTDKNKRRIIKWLN